jgi:hypothetical protein
MGGKQKVKTESDTITRGSYVRSVLEAAAKIRNDESRQLIFNSKICAFVRDLSISVECIALLIV